MENELLIKVSQNGIYRKLVLNGKVYEDETYVEFPGCYTTENAISIQLENEGIDIDLDDDLTDLYEILISM
jgi:hypothetical protein